MQPNLGTVDDNGFVWTVPRTTFVRLYVATGDARTSARDAKLPKDDDPEELLAHESVRAAVQSLHEQVLRRIHETEDTVLSRYSNWAEGNLVDYIDFGDLGPGGRVLMHNVKPRDFRNMPRHMQQRVKKFKITHTAQDNTNFEIELHDPIKANDMLARILGLDKEASAQDPKEVADAIASFLAEIEGIDEHYVDPDSVDNPDGVG